ncbi:MAG: DUF1553 domain-containing protein [Planctomycetaceae bacterium]
MNRFSGTILAFLAIIGSTNPSFLCAEDAPKSTAKSVDYMKDVKPLLGARCVSCHGPLRQRGGLRLDAGRLILKGGDSGAAMVPGKPEKSLIFHAITGTGDVTKMPLEAKPLTKSEVAIIRRWIQTGATFPADEKIADDPRNHWAFKPPVRPKLPVVKNPAWMKNPIDRFIAAKHREKKLVPQRLAEKYVLLRRVYLDVMGLPPTPAQLNAFLSDRSPNAYEKVVDQLLASPRYGERWGRHWMDVWRYSDWYGYRKELRNSARHIWRWRDWIVESLNKDKPYNAMLMDMLAADELAPTNASRIRATGYLARHYYKFNRNTWLDGVIEHTGKAFLGMTFNCARCHDHMYDPISQKEYYKLRAVFEPYQVRTRRVAGVADLTKDGIAMAYDANLAVKTFVFERGNDKYPDKDHPVSPAIPELLTSSVFKIQPIKLPPAAWYPGLRPDIRKELLDAAHSEIKKRRAELQKLKSKSAAKTSNTKSPNRHQLELKLAASRLQAALANLASLEARIQADDAKYAKSPPKNLKQLQEKASMAEKQSRLRAAEMELALAEFALAKLKPSPKGKPDKARQTALKQKQTAEKKIASARSNLKKNSTTYSPLTKIYPRISSGRRLALARWIANRKNPLTARVAVNHIWMRHFGKPLVPTVFDFGKNGKPASHPQLLDWLAVQFMDDGWSMKKLHRLILTSRVYRLSSSSVGAAKSNRSLDPDNQFLWRMNARRMEAEVVRDSVLFVAGKLDEKMGGPELDSKLGQTTFRRSLYYRHAPEKSMMFLKTFDAASAFECYRRNETVVPQQALAMVNSTLTLRLSRELAASLNRHAGTEHTDQNNGAFIHSLFVRVLNRPPTSDEEQLCRDFLAQQTTRLKQQKGLTSFQSGPKIAIGPSPVPHLRARENLTHVLLNHHEFVTAR